MVLDLSPLGRRLQGGCIEAWTGQQTFTGASPQGMAHSSETLELSYSKQMR